MDKWAALTMTGLFLVLVAVVISDVRARRRSRQLVPVPAPEDTMPVRIVFVEPIMDMVRIDCMVPSPGPEPAMPQSLVVRRPENAQLAEVITSVLRRWADEQTIAAVHLSLLQGSTRLRLANGSTEIQVDLHHAA